MDTNRNAPNYRYIEKCQCCQHYDTTIKQSEDDGYPYWEMHCTKYGELVDDYHVCDDFIQRGILKV